MRFELTGIGLTTKNNKNHCDTPKSNVELLFGRLIAGVCFSHFRTLDPETADLARELIDASDVQRSAFSWFVDLWMGFNGWMECVTDDATDAEMITALANHKRLTEAYNELMRNSPDFCEKVEAFATMWPVLNVCDVRRKLGRVQQIVDQAGRPALSGTGSRQTLPGSSAPRRDRSDRSPRQLDSGPDHNSLHRYDRRPSIRPRWFKTASMAGRSLPSAKGPPGPRTASSP